MEFLGAILGALVFIALFAVMVLPIILISSILNGYVLSILWGWFVVPVFHLPTLTFAQAIGISLVIRMIVFRVGPNKSNKDGENNKKKFLSALVEVILTPFATLGIGYIIHLFT